MKKLLLISLLALTFSCCVPSEEQQTSVSKSKTTVVNYYSGGVLIKSYVIKEEICMHSDSWVSFNYEGSEVWLNGDIQLIKK